MDLLARPPRTGETTRDTRADRRGLVLAAEPVTSNEVGAPLIRRLKIMPQATCCRIVLSNTKYQGSATARCRWPGCRAGLCLGRTVGVSRATPAGYTDQNGSYVIQTGAANNRPPRSQLSSSRSPRQWRTSGPSHAIGCAEPSTRRLLTRILAAARQADENEAGLPKKHESPRSTNRLAVRPGAGSIVKSYDAGSAPVRPLGTGLPGTPRDRRKAPPPLPAERAR